MTTLVVNDLEKFRFVEIGRTKLSVAGDTITVSLSRPAAKELMIIIHIICSGNCNALLRFNNDSGTNYANRSSTNGAADVTANTQSSISIRGTGSSGTYARVIFVNNLPTIEKLAVMTDSCSNTATGAGNAPSRVEQVGKWVNITANINEVDIVNTDTGDYDVDSEVIVLGID